MTEKVLNFTHHYWWQPSAQLRSSWYGQWRNRREMSMWLLTLTSSLLIATSFSYTSYTWVFKIRTANNKLFSSLTSYLGSQTVFPKTLGFPVIIVSMSFFIVFKNFLFCKKKAFIFLWIQGSNILLIIGTKDIGQ